MPATPEGGRAMHAPTDGRERRFTMQRVCTGARAPKGSLHEGAGCVTRLREFSPQAMSRRV